MALAAGVTWSLGAVTARTAHGMDAWQYLIWRSVGVIVVMSAFAAWRREGSPFPKAFRAGWVMRIACIGLMLASVAFIYALKNTSAANAAFLASVTPLMAVVLARVFIGERLTVVTVVSIAVASVGLLVMVTADVGGGNLKGNIAALLSSLSPKLPGGNDVAVWGPRILELPPVDISSTMIRTRVAAGESIEGMVAPAVASLIAERGLYR